MVLQDAHQSCLEGVLCTWPMPLEQLQDFPHLRLAILHHELSQDYVPQRVLDNGSGPQNAVPLLLPKLQLLTLG